MERNIITVTATTATTTAVIIIVFALKKWVNPFKVICPRVLALVLQCGVFNFFFFFFASTPIGDLIKLSIDMITCPFVIFTL